MINLQGKKCFKFCQGKAAKTFKMAKKDIKNLAFEELKRELEELSEPPYRAKQIFSWIYHKGINDFTQFSNLPQYFREELNQIYFLSTLELSEHLKSKDNTEKFLFKLADEAFIETVLIPSEHRKTVCLSSQVGCKYGCSFCASGLKGFTRNLTPSEITNQILFLRHNLKNDLTNFVFMGMGEPFDNYENVTKAITIMNTPEGMNIGARRLTISTCGVIPGIERLKNYRLQVNLSLSLHAVTDNLREKLMPINKKFPLEKLIKACEDFCKESGRKMTLEYMLIHGLNDSFQDAEGLARIAKRLKAKVNLINYSNIGSENFKPALKRNVDTFMSLLDKKGVSATLRKSKGQDIQAACGQLAGKKKG